MNPTHAKVQRNLAGLEFLLSRPDTRDMPPQTHELDKGESFPAFRVCRTIMHDGLTVIGISLRVNIIRMSTKEWGYSDVHGRGTTFEMALFDLSANLIRILDENDIVDTEDIRNYPILEERTSHDTENTDKGVRSDQSGAVKRLVNPAESDVGKGLAARSDNSGGSGPDARRHSGRRGKAAGGSRGRGRIKRAGR